MFNDGAKQPIKDTNSSSIEIEKEEKSPETSVSLPSTVDPVTASLNVSQTSTNNTTDDISETSVPLDAPESSTPASKEFIEEAIKKIQARSARHAAFFQEQMRIATFLDDLDFKIKNRYGRGYDFLVHTQTTITMEERWSGKKSQHDAKNEAMVTIASFAPGGECCPSKPLSEKEDEQSNRTPSLRF